LAKDTLVKRIMIVGCAGAGKSTLARRLSEKTGLPVFHIDRIYWTEGWVNRSREDTRRLVAEAIAGDEWIFEGNNSSSFDIRIAKADTVIFIDPPMWLCLFRVLKRIIGSHGLVRPDMADGCPENFDWAFLKWIVGYRKTHRWEVVELLEGAPASVTRYHLTSRAAVAGFLASV
jgi:adenylate kinase family enzyme